AGHRPAARQRVPAPLPQHHACRGDRLSRPDAGLRGDRRQPDRAARGGDADRLRQLSRDQPGGLRGDQCLQPPHRPELPMSAAAPPTSRSLPHRAGGFFWSCISTPVNAALSLAIVLALLYWLPGLLDWALVDARWSGPPSACRESSGACWSFIGQRWPLILYGGYPEAERWRVDLLFGVVLAAGALLLSGRVRHKGL